MHEVETTGSIGCLGVLALIFITLKLAQVGLVASWSWLWVLSPIWIPIVIILIIAIIWYITTYGDG